MFETIKQITAVETNKGLRIFGIDKTGSVHIWNWSTGRWYPWKKPEQATSDTDK